MLFHIKHEHTHDRCPATDPKLMNDTFKQILSQEHSKKCNVTLLSAYIDGPGHTIFMIVDTNNMGNLVKFLLPLNKIGKGEVSAVVAARELKKLLDMES